MFCILSGNCLFYNYLPKSVLVYIDLNFYPHVYIQFDKQKVFLAAY